MLVEHHTKYKEIDGIDETVWITQSEHSKYHKQRIKMGYSKIPREIVNKAHHRTNKHIAISRFNAKLYSPNYKRFKYYVGLEDSVGVVEVVIYNIKTNTISFQSAFQSTKDKYHKQNRYRFNLAMSLGDGIGLREELSYNYKTGNIGYDSSFYTHGKKLPVVEVN